MKTSLEFRHGRPQEMAEMVELATTLGVEVESHIEQRAASCPVLVVEAETKRRRSTAEKDMFGCYRSSFR